MLSCGGSVVGLGNNSHKWKGCILNTFCRMPVSVCSTRDCSKFLVFKTGLMGLRREAAFGAELKGLNVSLCDLCQRHTGACGLGWPVLSGRRAFLSTSPSLQQEGNSTWPFPSPGVRRTPYVLPTGVSDQTDDFSLLLLGVGFPWELIDGPF